MIHQHNSNYNFVLKALTINHYINLYFRMRNKKIGSRRQKDGDCNKLKMIDSYDMGLGRKNGSFQ